jgi:trehalose 6-phosphate phosphatase
MSVTDKPFWPATVAECLDEQLPPSVRDAEAAQKLDEFFAELSGARESALLLDFDGTLAPFRIDASKARPWAGVTSLLDALQRLGSARVVIVTGRPAQAAAQLLQLARTPEVWGLHGAECLSSDGTLQHAQLSAEMQQGLDAARRALHMADLGLRIEEKPNAIGVHWRGERLASTEAPRRRALQLFAEHAGLAGMKLLKFDGGLELRAGPDKGDAVRAILDRLPNHAPVAYLGDDTTDEDAFRALGAHGLSVLVRRECRPSAAHIWLRPPQELRQFLGRWLQAVER